MVSFRHNALRNGHCLDLTTDIPVARTGLLHNYFSFRIVKLWNGLPLDLRSIEISDNETNSPFKRALRQYYHGKLVDHFVSENS